MASMVKVNMNGSEFNIDSLEKETKRGRNQKED